jgi:hypothetical protein|tara:strand:+ start:1152 stop:1433 length:282 start_codon:yes stop_codon:yes gene_type:complete
MIRPLTFVRYPNYEHSDTSGVEPFETVLRGYETQTFAYGDRFVHLKNTRDDAVAVRVKPRYEVELIKPDEGGEVHFNWTNERAKSNFTSHFIA